MNHLFLATLGQRPEAITVAFDKLRAQYHYDGIAILHTEPSLSGITAALQALKPVLERDYAALTIHYHTLYTESGEAIIDIDSRHSAEQYHRAVLSLLYSYKQRGYRLHLLVSGGRKAMSIYATLAASVIFNPPHDKVWTVLSPDSMVAQPNQFHIPPGLLDAVQVVDMPIVSARLAPGVPPQMFIDQPRSNRDRFMSKLTREERVVAEMLAANAYLDNQGLAERLNKSTRTVENQLRSIYEKMMAYFDFGETLPETTKRIALLDVLRDTL